MEKRFVKLLALCLSAALLLPLWGCSGAGRKDAGQDTQAAGTEGAEDAGPLPAGEPATEQEPPAEQTVTADSPYHGSAVEFQIIGFEQYGTIEGEHYTDTPAEGNCYLVLFLSVQNNSLDALYMNPDDVRATVDGEAVENTFLLNDPEGYRSVFDTVDAGNTRQGFIVWEVPSGWGELSLRFATLEHAENVILDATLTPGDLLEVPEYSEYDGT